MRRSAREQERRIKQERELAASALAAANASPSPRIKTERRASSKKPAGEKEPHTKNDASDATMTEYERKRLENIQRNLDFMKSMGVSTAKAAARTAIGGASVSGHLAPKTEKRKSVQTDPLAPRRKSQRILGERSDLVELSIDQSRHGPAKQQPQYHYTHHETAAARQAQDDDAWQQRRLTAQRDADALNASSRSRLQSITRDRNAASLDSDSDSDDREATTVDATGVDTIDYTLAATDVVKATPERICSLAFHPRADKLVVLTGDKRGHVALWNADFASDSDAESNGAVALFRPHTESVTQLLIAPHDRTTLWSSSFDGRIQSFDLDAAVFTQVFQVRDKHVGVTSLALAATVGTFLASDDVGRVYLVDPRAPASYHPFVLHDKKINTVHQHPELSFCFATASLDRTVRLWDMRTMACSTPKPLVTMPHHRSVNCAYFSPTGAHLVTVGQDDHVNVFATRDATHVDPQSVAPSLIIPHNNQTGRWLTKFHAAWDPLRPDRFVLASMQQPRRLELFCATRKQPIQHLTSELFNSVHSINAFHPTRDVIAGGNSSGRLALWRSPVRQRRRNRRSNGDAAS